MVAGSITRESALAVPRDRIWISGVLKAHSLIPQILSDFVSSAELIEGDGGVGTVKLIRFTQAVRKFSFQKEKIEVLDHENCVLKQKVIEGGLIGSRLSSYSVEMKFSLGSNGETLVKVTVEYDTLDDNALSDEEKAEIIEGIFVFVKAMEEFLVANPAA